MSEQPKQRRKRSYPVKPEVLPLLEKTMREKGFVYTTQEQMYEELYEKTGRAISIDTIKNFFNPQFGRNPEKNTIQTIATTLGWMPEDLVEEWVAPTKIKKISTNNSEVTIDISIFQRMLDKQINNLTFNNSFLTEKLIKTADIYVPLGLIERKEKSKHGEVKPEQGSALYRANEYEISRKFENDQFLTEVLLQRDSPKSQGRRIAIIGEPGSGKSTRLQQVALWLIKQSSENHVIWISLADLRGCSLENYLLRVWLKNALSKLESSKEDQEELVEIFNQGNVWLLLDGIDEMGLLENPLAWVNRQLCGWLDQAKIITTCRINIWDGNRQALNGFDVYRNLDFSDYQRDKFINIFLDNKELSEGLINELNKPGKERIRDLARNPLRLKLICWSWQKRQGTLPNTKVELYEECVEKYYDLKQEPSTTLTQRKELNRALGELAKQALDRDDFRFRMTETQVSQVLGESDQGLFKLALNLGWLNEIGEAEENHKKIYAFLHPSFQEYFAAITIDNPSFFFHHDNEKPNPFKNINGQQCQYRIFRSQWKEVFLLWMTRSNIANEVQESLRYSLINFNDGCDGLFAKDYIHILIDELIGIIATSYPGHDQDWDKLENVIQKTKKIKDIYSWNSGIKDLFFYKTFYNLGIWIHDFKKCKIHYSSQVLEQKSVTVSFVSKLKEDNYYGHRFSMIFLLDSFYAKNYKQHYERIRDINIVFEDHVNKILLSKDLAFLCDIIGGGTFERGLAIRQLTELVSFKQVSIINLLDEYQLKERNDIFLSSLIYILGDVFCITNIREVREEVIDTLLTLDFNGREEPTLSFLLAFIKIILEDFVIHGLIIKDKLCIIVRLLKSIYLTNFGHNNELLHIISEDLLRILSNQMSYPEFYNAWNNEFIKLQSQQEFLDEQIKSSPYSLSIKTENLNSIVDKIKLLQRFKKRIFQSLPLEIKPQIQIIFGQPTQNIEVIAEDLVDQIEDIFIEIKDQLKINDLVLFLDNRQPSQLLLETCDQFNDLVKIEWNR
ncbi:MULTISPECIES: NACHT domain-containing NTPase [unclassified Synechocystis]|uniref:NACHT domain-containing protein n=1 Tax=unclassified Synechocystis TaxID=2640012 RepID=UPI0004140035|nr:MULTISPECIES: NACHT domain-containing protein [unclassified Synechocystis]AIE73889.1 hypothetical protein D082_13610 [Synechocystis sp. PCC 6714]MCT0252464.1 NACHT domain-containing protein [Synechocystis sp. CS-94]